MHFLTEEYIKSLVKKESTYLKGLRIYKSDKILDLYQIPPHRPDSDDLYFKAKIFGSQIYNLNIKLEKKGKLISASCECPSYYSTTGNCKHITAALLYIKEHHFKDNAISEDINQLVEIYKNLKSVNVDLLPSFAFDYGKVGISLKAGKSQYYVVKNIKKLIQLINYGEFYSYGINLAFVHTIKNFNKRSRKLINYIKSDVEVKDSEYYYNYPFDNRRTLEIHPLCAVKLLELYEGEQLEFNISGETRILIYSKEEPPITFVFEDGKMYIKEDYEVILLNSIGFYIFDNKIYNIDNLANKNLIPLVNYIKNNKYLLINDSNSNKFFGLIYPKIKDGIKIENEEELSKLNKIKDLKIKVYLDIKDGILYLDYKFFYGDLTKEEALVNNEFINEEVEDNFIDFIYELGFDKENLTIENDELIYDFLTNQIENLKQYAEVYISESIKNINIRQMKQPSVGVRFDNNLLEVSFDNLDFDVKELEKVLRTYQLKRKFYRLKDGSVIVLKNEYMDLLNETYEALNVKANQLSDINYVESYKAMKFSNILEHIDEDVNLKEFIDSLVNYEKADYPLDEHFNQVLRSYQKIGYKWLVNLTKYRLGGILADEMGLGKTIQIIALLENDQEDMPSLIVTPASLIYNWEYEFKQFSPSSNVLVIDGNVSERKEAIKNINGKQFIITSYDYLKRDIEYYNNLQFRFCIIDEAQNIKNQTTKNAKSVKSIDAQVRFALTGTPIENALSDLWSIFDFILPGYFRTYERFKREYEIDIVKNDDEHKLKKLSMQISPFILRRTKKEVLSELPPKVEQVIYAKMDEEQKRIYQAMLLNIKRKIINPETNKFEVLSYLTRLRQVCCDPNLIIDSYMGESPKLELTASLVEESINAGHKILIFSQFTSMLDLIAQKLDSIKIPYLTLIGETPKKERLDLVNKFNSSVKFNVFLISLKAGGLGLNLTSADTIIHYDPWWNVSAENQASDRAHRIGQTKTVQVMKLIMKDSIEEKIIKLQELKQQLVDNVINDEEKLISKLTYAEILSLFE